MGRYKSAERGHSLEKNWSNCLSRMENNTITQQMWGLHPIHRQESKHCDIVWVIRRSCRESLSVRYDLVTCNSSEATLLFEWSVLHWGTRQSNSTHSEEASDTQTHLADIRKVPLVATGGCGVWTDLKLSSGSLLERVEKFSNNIQKPWFLLTILGYDCKGLVIIYDFRFGYSI